MIHPSYKELIEKINEGQESDEAPVISSRYSLVLAASKRARQLIAGAEPKVKVKKGHEASLRCRGGNVQGRGYDSSGRDYGGRNIGRCRIMVTERLERR